MVLQGGGGRSGPGGGAANGGEEVGAERVQHSEGPTGPQAVPQHADEARIEVDEVEHGLVARGEEELAGQ